MSRPGGRQHSSKRSHLSPPNKHTKDRFLPTRPGLEEPNPPPLQWVAKDVDDIVLLSGRWGSGVSPRRQISVTYTQSTGFTVTERRRPSFAISSIVHSTVTTGLPIFWARWTSHRCRSRGRETPHQGPSGSESEKTQTYLGD